MTQRPVCYLIFPYTASAHMCLAVAPTVPWLVLAPTTTALPLPAPALHNHPTPAACCFSAHLPTPYPSLPHTAPPLPHPCHTLPPTLHPASMHCTSFALLCFPATSTSPPTRALPAFRRAMPYACYLHAPSPRWLPLPLRAGWHRAAPLRARFCTATVLLLPSAHLAFHSVCHYLSPST